MRILIADDSPLARSAIGGSLQGQPDFAVVGEAADGYEAVAQVQALQPDLVLMDLNMPRCDGLLATRLIKKVAPQTVIVILTVSDEATDLFEALRSGAQGYLLKGMDPADWFTYLRGFAKGDWNVPPAMARRILGELNQGGSDAPRAPVQPPDSRLTDREQAVLRLVARAMTNREIAQTLVISEQTVKNHLKNMMQKLHLKNRVDLAVFARRHRPEEQS